MSISLDGYTVDRGGSLDWGAPSDEVFRFNIDGIRDVGVYLMGRRLYETMLYWETAEQDPDLGDLKRDWAQLWLPLPKIVFSTTITAVEGNARLATGNVAEEIARLRVEPGDGDIAIGGATLAGEAAALGLLDEYRTHLCPVVIGGGISLFRPGGRQVDLELVESRVFDSGTVFLRHRVKR